MPTVLKAMFTAVLAVLSWMLLPALGWALPLSQQEAKEKIAVLPFEQKGLSDEEAATLTKKFADLLQPSARFIVMPYDEMLRLLTEADFKIQACSYSYCLADAGKVLGVQKVLHGSVTRRGKFYTLHIRLIDVRTAEIVHDRKQEHSGELDRLVADVLPEEAKAAAEYSVESGTKWYVVATAIVLTVGTIYSLYRVFNKTGATESTGEGPPTPQ